MMWVLSISSCSLQLESDGKADEQVYQVSAEKCLDGRVWKSSGRCMTRCFQEAGYSLIKINIYIQKQANKTTESNAY